jgi:NAD(P)-dependent dehydrogenase (short-subunit alcohol dehydrogenase family)
MMSRVKALPRPLRSEVAYGISKNFVIWYARTDAAKCGAKGIRVLSVSPGSFETPMGPLVKLVIRHDLTSGTSSAEQAANGWIFICNGMKTLVEIGKPLPMTSRAK